MRDFVIETDRLYLRKIVQDDFMDISNILQDIDVMYAWEKSFSNEEVQEWIDKNLDRYNNEGYSYFLALNKETNEVIGVMGPLIEEIKGNSFIGIAYILNKKFWKKGYATEGVKGCLNYAFNNLNAQKVIAQIRTSNSSSCMVADRLNMQIIDKYVRIYDNKAMEHLVYSIDRDTYFKSTSLN